MMTLTGTTPRVLDWHETRKSSIEDAMITRAEARAERELAKAAARYASLQRQIATRQKEADYLKQRLLNSVAYGATEADGYRIVRSLVAATIIPEHIRHAHDALRVTALS